jgi:hypothetical protein
MTKLISFSKISRKLSTKIPLERASIVVDDKGNTQGLVFGRDALISFLEYLDEEFEKRVPDPQKAFDNPAGKLIDVIEENLPLNPVFVNELKKAIKATKSQNWVSLAEIKRILNV